MMKINQRYCQHPQIYIRIVKIQYCKNQHESLLSYALTHFVVNTFISEVLAILVVGDWEGFRTYIKIIYFLKALTIQFYVPIKSYNISTFKRQNGGRCYVPYCGSEIRQLPFNHQGPKMFQFVDRRYLNCLLLRFTKLN